jgi:hypothetical protein
VSKWDDLIDRTVTRVGLDCRLVRLADPNVPGSTDVEVNIKIANAQFREREQPSGGDVTQQNRYYAIPAKALQATGFPVPPKPGDRVIFAGDLDEVTTIRNVGPGVAEGGRVVRWDIEVVGIGV